MALIVLCILVHENSWIGKKEKRLFYLTYGIIALSALAEWLGVQFSGNEDIPGRNRRVIRMGFPRHIEITVFIYLITAKNSNNNKIQ